MGHQQYGFEHMFLAPQPSGFKTFLPAIRQLAAWKTTAAFLPEKPSASWDACWDFLEGEKNNG